MSQGRTGLFPRAQGLPDGSEQQTPPTRPEGVLLPAGTIQDAALPTSCSQRAGAVEGRGETGSLAHFPSPQQALTHGGGGSTPQLSCLLFPHPNSTWEIRVEIVKIHSVRPPT